LPETPRGATLGVSFAAVHAMKYALALLAVTLLGACSHPTAPAAPPEPKAAAAAHPDNPLDPLLKTRDRAAAVQGTVDQQAAQQRAAIDAQGQ
jgi:hypothetical protein